MLMINLGMLVPFSLFAFFWFSGCSIMSFMSLLYRLSKSFGLKISFVLPFSRADSEEFISTTWWECLVWLALFRFYIYFGCVFEFCSRMQFYIKYFLGNNVYNTTLPHICRISSNNLLKLPLLKRLKSINFLNWWNIIKPLLNIYKNLQISFSAS